ncbi:hypothetical protein [Raineyella sp.]|uniref:hypothetical protein n=1 Tax=Raineyella sp. TaxID=1911550 RepID=UPI002B205851|nr:hypothetical protein [Raineyella sp.]MEA5154624.1 hypothetical protein [Raineyella sp.]
MGIVVIAVVVALVLAVVIAGVVVVGMRGGLPEVSEKAPDLAGGFEWAARQLSGEAEPSPRMAGFERTLARRRRADGSADPDGTRPTQPDTEATPGRGPGAGDLPFGARPGPDGRTPPRGSDLPTTGDFGA